MKKFTMETTSSIRSVIKKDKSGSLLDTIDAFFHVELAKCFCKYFWYNVAGRLFKLFVLGPTPDYLTLIASMSHCSGLP